MVHITDLAEPEAAKLVRSVDPDHVKFLTDELRQSSDLFIMAGLDHEEVELEELKEPLWGRCRGALWEPSNDRLAVLSSGHLQK